LRAEGQSQREIAAKLGVDHATVCRDCALEAQPVSANAAEPELFSEGGGHTKSANADATVATVEIDPDGAIKTGSPSDDLDLPMSFAMLDLKGLARAAKFRMLKLPPGDVVGALTASSTSNEELARHIRKISGPLAARLKEMSKL
jgi:hypothetical protein